MSSLKRNILILVSAILIVVSNGLIGHFLAPWGVLLTPLVLTLVSILITIFMRNISIIYQATLLYLHFAFNDLGNRIFAGGTHDQVGNAIISISGFIGLVIMTLFLLVAIFRCRDEKEGNRTIAFILFILLSVIHYLLFSNFGVSW